MVIGESLESFCENIPPADGDLSAHLRLVTLEDFLHLNCDDVNRVLVVPGIGFNFGFLDLCRQGGSSLPLWGGTQGVSTTGNRPYPARLHP